MTSAPETEVTLGTSRGQGKEYMKFGLGSVQDRVKYIKRLKINLSSWGG